MPSKLAPHFMGTPGFERWLGAGVRVIKFDPTCVGTSEQLIGKDILAIGKLDQEDANLGLTDWKAMMNRGLSPAETAKTRFEVQRHIFAGPNKPIVDRYLVNGRIDVWEDDNEVVPDNVREAQWYAAYCIEMMRHYESIGKKRANFNFATGTPDIRPGEENDIWPHLLPAIRHARDKGHYLALHEYMGPEADMGVGHRQVDIHRDLIPNAWHGRRDAAGNPDESYPYGYCPLRYRYIYDVYLRPAGLADIPLLITECGCDGVDTITPKGMESGSYKHLRDHFWPSMGVDPDRHYASMLEWYDQRLREDPYVIGAMIFTVGSRKGAKVGGSRWVDFDISGSTTEEHLLAYIARERAVADRVIAPRGKSGAQGGSPSKPKSTAPDKPASASSARIGIVTAPAGLNLRARPTTAGDEKIIDLLRLGSQVEIIDRVGDWYEVRANGKHGYVYAAYVTLNIAPPDARETALESALEGLEAIAGVEFGFVSAPAGLNLRAQPVNGTILDKLPFDTRVELLELANGWYRVRHEAQEGYVSAEWIRTTLPAPVAIGHKPRTASVVGIHGAPGGAAPPRHMWNQWTDYLNQMGIRWYKQCEVSEDTGENSIYSWVLHLKQNGIEPIIRYQMNAQFPNNLYEGLFRQMKRYADKGVRWAEIGNEPNLDYEWQEGWRGLKEKYMENNEEKERYIELPRMRWGEPEAIATLARVWIEDATRAADLGAWPAFYAFGPTDVGDRRPNGLFSSTKFTELVVARLASHHRAETIRLFNERGAWIAVHVAKYEKDLSYNPYSEDASRPWDMCMRGYEVVRNAFRNHFGNDLKLNTIPIVSTEGGIFTPEHKNKTPGRVPPNDEEHARQTIEMFDYVERQTPLTAMCPWCISESDFIGIRHPEGGEFRDHGWFKQVGDRLVERPVYSAMRRLRQEMEKSVSLETLAEPGLEPAGETAPEAAEATITISISVQIKVTGAGAKDVVIHVNPTVD